MEGETARVGNARCVGSGRAKLRLSRGLPFGLAHDFTPQILAARTTGKGRRIVEGETARVGNARCVGSGRAKLRLSRGLPFGLAHDFTPQISSVNDSNDDAL